MIRHTLLIIFTSLNLIVSAATASAETYHYMDGGGNLHFVDKLGDVPFRYRNQIPEFNLTPVAVVDSEKEARRQQEKAREKERQQQLREQERRRREMELQRRARGKKIKVTPPEATKIAEERIKQEQEIARKQAQLNAARDPHGFLPDSTAEVQDSKANDEASSENTGNAN